MNVSEETQMREIAQRCPLDDGFGVYMARATLLKLDTLPRHYLSECEQSPAPTIREEWKVELESSPESYEFRIYPNPNNGQMTLGYTLEESEKGEVNFYNAIGQHVLTQTLKEGVNLMSVNLNNVSSGVYSVVGVVNGEIRLSEKVSILRE